MRGREILDAMILANEVDDDLIGNKRERILCKVDMEKAENHLN